MNHGEPVTLADLEWGDVVSEGDGVLVVEGTVEVDGEPRQVLVKRYEDPDEIADAANHLLLAQLGMDVFAVLGHGPGWLVLDHPEERWGWRLAEPDDLSGDAGEALVGAWQSHLATISASMPELVDGRHLALALVPDWTGWAVTQDLSRAVPIDLRGLTVS